MSERTETLNCYRYMCSSHGKMVLEAECKFMLHVSVKVAEFWLHGGSVSNLDVELRISDREAYSN